MALVKSIALGMIASIGISFVMHGQTSRLGGMLAIQRFPLDDFSLFWSWPIFCVATAMAWVLFKFTEPD